MIAILKSTTNTQMLSGVGKKFWFYDKPIKNEPFVCHHFGTTTVIFSSMVAFVGNVGNTLRIATANSEYIFEVIE
ncbi:hypothetical protein [uncultured Enterococcus sp.]|uniref:hypothetical protein n=1 Tax=uncultured Enterococcus sp. TaxID=167972 RepID=UPI002591FCDE|nr:hypothetical protein [uncultured Enterococcus sp.]